MSNPENRPLPEQIQSKDVVIDGIPYAKLPEDVRRIIDIVNLPHTRENIVFSSKNTPPNKTNT